MAQLLERLLAVAVAVALAVTPDATRPVVWTWNATEFPACVVDCEKVVDGPMTANGDLGEPHLLVVVVGFVVVVVFVGFHLTTFACPQVWRLEDLPSMDLCLHLERMTSGDGQVHVCVRARMCASVCPCVRVCVCVCV